MIDQSITKQELEKLINKYPWLINYSSNREQYIPPEYYNNLLKDYSFNNLTDLEYLNKFLTDVTPKNNLNVLELGCGSGRCTEIAIKTLGNNNRYTLTDLSSDMLEFVENKFREKKLSIIRDDHLNFINKCSEKYDVIYCLWSFSHSVHQHIEKEGKHITFKKMESGLNNLILNNLAKDGKMFLIHFDTCSEEQRILVKQWGKDFPEFNLKGKQSFSKRFLDKILLDISNKIPLKVSITHLLGDPINYDSLNQTMEIFVNFHMETEYNRSKNLPTIIKELEKDLSKYNNEKGLAIRPGCFIYEINKI